MARHVLDGDLGGARLRHVVREHALEVERAGGQHQSMTGEPGSVIAADDDVAKSLVAVETVHLPQRVCAATRVFVCCLLIGRQVRPRQGPRARRAGVREVHEVRLGRHLFTNRTWAIIGSIITFIMLIG